MVIQQFTAKDCSGLHTQSQAVVEALLHTWQRGAATVDNDGLLPLHLALGVELDGMGDEVARGVENLELVVLALLRAHPAAARVLCPGGATLLMEALQSDTWARRSATMLSLLRGWPGAAAVADRFGRLALHVALWRVHDDDDEPRHVLPSVGIMPSTLRTTRHYA